MPVSFRPSKASGEILRDAETMQEMRYRRMYLPHRVISTKAKPHGEILRCAESMQEMRYRRMYFPRRVISTKAKPHGEILRCAETRMETRYRSLHFLFSYFLRCYFMAGGQDLSTSLEMTHLRRVFRYRVGPMV